MPDNYASIAFWKWFALHVDETLDAYLRDDVRWLDVNITPQVHRINRRINWELGPYNDPDTTFVLSPTIRDNLPITRASIAIAPKLEEWTFLPAKPPKDLLSLTFSAGNSTINADNWRYRLTTYNKGEFVDIELYINEASDFPTKYDSLFCELVVEALLGEEIRLERVGYLMPYVVPDNTTIEKSTSIRLLREHVGQVLSTAPYET